MLLWYSLLIGHVAVDAVLSGRSTLKIAEAEPCIYAVVDVLRGNTANAAAASLSVRAQC
jgi:hypothetical protein